MQKGFRDSNNWINSLVDIKPRVGQEDGDGATSINVRRLGRVASEAPYEIKPLVDDHTSPFDSQDCKNALNVINVSHTNAHI